MFSKFGSNRTAVSQIPKIWQDRTEPEPNFENTNPRIEKTIGAQVSCYALARVTGGF